MLSVTENGVEVAKLPLVYFFCEGGMLDRLELVNAMEKLRVWKTLLLQYGIGSQESVVLLAMPADFIVLGIKASIHVFSGTEKGSLRDRLGVPNAGQIAFLRESETATVLTESACFAVSFRKGAGIKIDKKKMSADV